MNSVARNLEQIWLQLRKLADAHGTTEITFSYRFEDAINDWRAASLLR